MTKRMNVQIDPIDRQTSETEPSRKAAPLIVLVVAVLLACAGILLLSRSERPASIALVDSLIEPMPVAQVSADHLILSDGERLPLPDVERLSSDSAALSAATARGVEITENGRTIGLVRIHHTDEHDHIGEHLARVDIAHLLQFLGQDGSDATSAPCASWAEPPGGTFTAAGMPVEQYRAFVRWSESRDGTDPTREYDFDWDHKLLGRFLHSLHGTPDQPRPGDVISAIIDPPITLGEPGTYRFKYLDDNYTRYYLEREDGSRQLISAEPEHLYNRETDVETIVDPLASLTPEQIHGLWGLKISECTDATLDNLQYINPDRLCLTVVAWSDEDSSSPPLRLPPNLKYLNLRLHPSATERGNPLAGLSSLQYLSIAGAATFDCAWLTECPDLRHLRFMVGGLDNVDQLSSLTELRELDFGSAAAVSDLSFARSMLHLTRLNISGTLITDLSPVAGLMKLRWLNASLSPVNTLPEGELPALQYLDVLSTSIPEAEVDAFRSEHPRCLVKRHWDQTLYEALVGTTRIRVRTGGSEITRYPQRTLFEETDPTRIRELIHNIHINEPASNYITTCYGNLTLEFYQGDHLITTITCPTAQGLRWDDGWPVDGELTTWSAACLRRWLNRNGIGFDY
jgi:hypothetical protein